MFRLILGISIISVVGVTASGPQVTFSQTLPIGGGLAALVIGDEQVEFKPPIKTYISPDSLFVSGPANVADMVNDMVGAKWERMFLALNCGRIPSLPPLSFNFSHGRAVELDAPEYLIRAGGNCFSPFLGDELPEPFVDIGQPFLQPLPPPQAASYESRLIPGIHVPLKSPSTISSEPQEVELKRVILGKQRAELHTTLALVYSGLLVMHFPMHISNALNEEIGAVKNHLLSILDCDSLPDLPDLVLELSLNGADIPLVLNSTSYTIRAGKNCFSPFVGHILNDSQPWIIGDVFIYRYGLGL